MSTYTGARSAAVKSGTEKSAKFRPSATRFIRWGTAIFLLLLATVYYAGYRSGSGEECGNKKNPCTAEANDKVVVPEGKLVCFDDSFWENLPRLGQTTSYKSGGWQEFTCTQEQVMAGVCKQQVFDAFRFNPKGGTRIPKYWFVKAGTKTC